MQYQSFTRFAFAALSLLSVSQAGCDSLWGYYSVGDPDNCVRIPNICASDEFCNRSTQACEKYILTMYPREDVLVPPTAPASFIMPGGKSPGLTHPRDVSYSLGAPVQSLPTATPQPTIYWTVDGTTPVPGDPMTFSGGSPVSLGRVPGGTTIKWLSVYGGDFAAEAVRSFSVGTDTTATTNAGFIMENASIFGANGPTAVVPRAGRVNIKVNLQVWASAASGTCPMCPTHVTVSVPTVGQVGCFTNINQLGAFPGQTFQMFISFTAPTTLGRFPVQAGVVQQARCDNALAPANAVEVAELITQ